MKIKIIKQIGTYKTKKFVVFLVAVLFVVSVPIGYFNNAFARDYDAEIAAKEQESAAYQAEAARLSAEADTLSVALAVIANEKNQIQSQIDLSQAKYDQLLAQIVETEKQISDSRDALGVTIANIYVDDNITPVEVVFGSKNISDYMDKQEYRNSVRNELTVKIAEIKKLKKQLETQKFETESILNDQKNRRAVLEAKQNEQQQLINETQGQESIYQELTSKTNSEVAKLRSEQAAANIRRAGSGFTSLPGDGTKGGYPAYWMSLPLDGAVDYWGMYTRECVSYAAFKVNQAYGNMPYWGGIGNANQWDDNARNLGIPIGTTPKPGSVGVMDSGYYGHVAWVESVNADGTINISHFNINWNGDYAEWYNLRSSFFDYYIYFGEWTK